MNSLILRTACKLLYPLMLLFAVFLLMRGHNEPGGGFCGGLIGAAAFALMTFSHDVEFSRSLLRIDPFVIMGTGLLFASGSGVLALLCQRPFLTGMWIDLEVPGLGHVGLGTPVLFDTGVFLVVQGVTLLIIYSMSEE